MTKKTNQRAQRKAQKKATKRNNRNTASKEQKRIERERNESFKFQFEKLTQTFDSKITQTKSRINVAIGKFKYLMQEPLFSKTNLIDREFILEDLIHRFATRENLSFALASIIMCNCLAATNSYVTNSVETLAVVSEETEVQDETSLATEPFYNYTKEYYEQHIQDIQHTLSQSDTKIAEIKEKMNEPKEFTNEEKIAIILDKYGITSEQFNIIVAYVLLEGGRSLVSNESENYYDECYRVTSVLFNRVSSASCIAFVNNAMGAGSGTNIYKQLICPGQFTPDKNTALALAKTDLSIYDGYQAVIDMLFSSKPSTDFYRFVAPRLMAKYQQYKGIQYSPNGNYFFAAVKDYDRVDLADILPNYSKYMTEEYLSNEGDIMDVAVDENTHMDAAERQQRLTLKPKQDSIVS